MLAMISSRNGVLLSLAGAYIKAPNDTIILEVIKLRDEENKREPYE